MLVLAAVTPRMGWIDLDKLTRAWMRCMSCPRWSPGTRERERIVTSVKHHAVVCGKREEGPVEGSSLESRRVVKLLTHDDHRRDNQHEKGHKERDQLDRLLVNKDKQTVQLALCSSHERDRRRLEGLAKTDVSEISKHASLTLCSPPICLFNHRFLHLEAVYSLGCCPACLSPAVFSPLEPG